MKTPVGFTPLVQSRPRWARLVTALAVAALGLSTASAQTTYGINLLAGQSVSPGSADGAGGSARFNTPQSVAVDAAGNLYVADTGGHTIRKIVVNTGVVSTVAGLAGTSGTADGTGGAGGTARFSSPMGIAVLGTTLYVSDTLNHTIREIDVSTATPTVTTRAGSAGLSANTDATGATARFSFPMGLAISGGSLYVADSGNHAIRKVVIGTWVVTTHAGPVGVTGTFGFTDGAAALARFNNPTGVAADNTNLYVTDNINNRIRTVSISTGAVNTLAGSGVASVSDGAGVVATFNRPSGIAIDSTGTTLGSTLFVTDAQGHTVRRIVITGAAVTTVAGSGGTSGSSDGLGTTARFTAPAGIALDAGGAIYIADTNNHVIRRGTAASAPVFSSVNNATFAVGAPGSFSVTASGSPAPTFSFTGTLPNGVTLSTAGALSGTPTTAIGSPFVITITATNGVVPAATQTFTLSVNHPPVFTSANNTTFVVNTAASFQFVATGSPAPTFSIVAGTLPPFVGSMNSAGLLTATPPTSTAGSPYTITVRATNTAGFVDQVFTLNITSGPTITTPPSPQVVSPGQTAQFSVSASANGGGTLTYQWQRQVAGTSGFFNLSDSGKYFGTATPTLSVLSTSPSETGDQFRAVVTGGVGTPATSAAASLTVTQAPTITSLNTATFVENQLGSFSVLATGSPSTITYSITGGSLPPGVLLDAATGVISGTATAGSSASSPYNVQITASNGVSPSATQLLAVSVSPTALLPAFTTQPINAAVSIGQTATYTVVVTGNPTPTIVWQRLVVGSGIFVDLINDANFSGVNTATLTVTNPTSGMSGDVFRAIATNSSGSSQSTSASLTVVVGATISTFAGQAGLAGSTDATGTAARFNGLTSVAVDLAGNIYVADSSNHVIRRVSSSGVVTTLAGLAGVSGSVDGTGSAARFNAPAGVAVSAVGTVFVADTYNHTIRLISADGVVTTLAGLAGNTGSTDAVGNLARFLYPYGIAVDPTGTAYVADTFNHTIRRVQSSGAVSTYAGFAGSRGTSNGLGSAARFNYPFAVASDPSGNLYVADSFNHAIRRIDLSSTVTTLAGNPGVSGSLDGTGSAAGFNQPSGIAVDNAGNVYVADTYNSTIRRVTLGGVVSSLAGTVAVTGSADGIGGEARFNQPFGIAVDGSGNLFVADTRNHTLRRSGTVAAPTIVNQPQSAVAAVGGSARFTVTATGAPTPAIFAWYRQPTGTLGFSPLIADDTIYSGVRSATLTVTGVTAAMAGDQFQVIVSNLISPNATSTAATLTLGQAPVITSAASATFQATFAGTFTVTATGTPTPTYSASGLPSWATIDATTGVISGTPPDTTGSPFSVTVTATNGIPVTQTLTLTVLPAVVAPTLSAQPQGAAVDRNGSVVLSVTAAGTAPLTYQWSRNGAAIAGATGSTLTLSSMQPSGAGSYAVTVTNSAGTVTSASALVVVNTAPVITTQPRSQTVAPGSVVTFSVGASGGTSFNYQWRKNGVEIAGARGSSLTLTGVTIFDGGFYDVLVSNGLGLVGSSVAPLTVVSTPTAPIIAAQPANRTIVIGSSTTLAVSASGSPAPSYQWRKNGVNIAGATTPTYTVAGVLAGEASSYDVIVNSTAGSVTSRGAVVRVLGRSYAGTYFGTFAGNLGSFAISIREDNTGVFLGYLPGSSAPVMSLNFLVNEGGTFSFSQGAIASTGDVSAAGDEPARAAALGNVTVSGTIGADGSLSGSLAGGANASLSGTRAFDTGATQGVAGFYQAGASNSAAISYVIAGSNSQSFAIVQSGNTSDGGPGSVTAAGAVNVLTSRSVISSTIATATGTVTGNSTGAVVASFTGGNEDILSRQRLVNISSRARVGTADNVAIAGFVISGEVSKPVLIRAVGPTLGSAFGVTGALASPRLELFRGQTSLGVNTGIAADRAMIDAASAQAGAFTLGSSGADAAILTTLAPGAYTAVVSSTTNTAGIALVEVYDLSGAAPGQKLLNIATRASAGSAEATLIAGFVVPPGSSKRVLIRGVGPGLTPFGVSGVLAQPTLQLLSGSTTVAQNTNWSTSADRDAIATSSAQVGAFGLANNDSALIATLAPGNYTAQVIGAGGATGVALIEVYELP